MTRSVEEWIGRSDNEPFPPRVRVRIFERANGHCQECGRKIGAADRWIADHIIAIVNGGPNRESNGRCICDWCDRKVKTPADVAIKAKSARVRAKHLGIKGTKPKGWWKGSGAGPREPRDIYDDLPPEARPHHQVRQ